MLICVTLPLSGDGTTGVVGEAQAVFCRRIFGDQALV